MGNFICIIFRFLCKPLWAKILICLWVFLFANLNLNAQLAGVNTINPANPNSTGNPGATAGANYKTFTLAINALNLYGISGSVIFNVSPGVYSEQIDVPNVLSASSLSKIVFQGMGVAANPVVVKFAASSALNDYVLRFNQAKYVSFRNITFETTASTANIGKVVVFHRNANSNTVENCVLNGRNINDVSDEYSVVYHNAVAILDNCANNTIQTCRINYGSNSFFFKGFDFLSLGENLILKSNLLNNYYSMGVKFQYQRNFTIESNDFLGKSEAPDNYGIQCGIGGENSKIIKNKILVHGASHSYGIYIYLIANLGAPLLIANNFISMFDHVPAHGIYLNGSGGGLNIYNNNVRILNNDLSSACIFTEVAMSNLNIRNNILTNFGSGYCSIYTLTISNLACTNNDYFNRGLNISKYNSTNYSFDTWRSSFDSNGLFLDPYFVSNTDLHVNNGCLNGMGLFLPEVVADIDEEARPNTNYDIGADEFTTTALGGSYYIDPTQATTFPSGTMFHSFGEAISVLNCNGVKAQTTFYVKSGEVFNESLPNLYFTGKADQQIVFKKDGNNANPVVKSTGIGGTNDATFHIIGSDYLTFDGIDVLPNFGANLDFGFWLQPASPSDGARYNTIQNCKIWGDNSIPNSAAIYQECESIIPSDVSGANSNNQYLNLVVEKSANGIILKGNSSYKDKNCYIGSKSGQKLTIGSSSANDIGGNPTVYGIYVSNSESLEVENCRIQNVTALGPMACFAYGIYLENVELYSEIHNNFIDKVSIAASGLTHTSFAMGLSFQGTASLLKVFSNNLSGFSSTITNNNKNNFLIGISINHIGNSSAQVFNNSIHSFSHSLNINSDTMNVIAISIDKNSSNSATTEIANNSIQINTPTNIFSSGLYLGQGDVRLLNNIIANFSSPSLPAKMYCVYRNPLCNLLQSNTNDFAHNSSTTCLAGYYGVDRNDLISWQLASGMDANSISTTPNFVSGSDLHLNFISGFDIGTPLLWVSKDFDNETRSLSNPVIGFDEKSVPIGTCNINTNTVWSGSVTVNCDVTINGGSVLSVMPGTIVKFDGNFGITVSNGSISAIGTNSSAIIFESLDTANTWEGFDYPNTSPAPSQFSNCFFNHARTNIRNGGVFQINSNNTIQFDHCSFYRNQGINGGAIFANNSTVNLENCSFRKNSSVSSGGAVFIWNGTCNTNKNTFESNSSGLYGGAFDATNSTITITNSRFWNNFADQNGGGLYLASISTCSLLSNLFHNNYGGTRGGALCINQSNCNSWNNTISKNASVYAGGISIDNNSNFNSWNDIVFGNIATTDGHEIYQSSGNSVIRYPLFGFAGASIYSNGNFTLEQELFKDPAFVSPSLMAGIDPLSKNANFSLRDSSSCINTGHPRTDITSMPWDMAGNLRVAFGEPYCIDRGAYEFIGNPNSPVIAGFGNCLNFNALDSAILIKNNANLSLDPENGSFSIELWLKAPPTNMPRIIVEKFDHLNLNKQWQLWFNGPDIYTETSGDRLVFTYAEDAFTIFRGCYTRRDIADGKWHHVAVVADKLRDTVLIYVDGLPEETVYFSAGAWPNIVIDDPVFVMEDHALLTEPRTDGSIDELRIWKKALSKLEIRENMYDLPPGNAVGLSAYYRFDEGVGGLAHDLTANKNHGYIHSGKWNFPGAPMRIITKKDYSYTGNLVGYDMDSTAVTFEITNPGAIGAASLINPSTGSSSYFRNVYGNDSIEYKVSSEGRSQKYKVHINSIYKEKGQIVGKSNYINWIADTVMVLGNTYSGIDTSLNIEKNTYIEFRPKASLRIGGVLNASGTLTDSIIFTASDTVLGWRGIRFENPLATSLGNDTSIFSYCRFSYGKANGISDTLNGGAIFVRNTNKLKVIHSYFYKNKATNYGGAFYLNNASALVRFSRFRYCNAMYGGAMAYNNGTSNSKIIYSIFENNSATTTGGAIHAYNNSTPIINSIFKDNFSSIGGAIYGENQYNAGIMNSNFCHNNASQGAAIYLQANSKPSILNSIFWFNISGSSPVNNIYLGDEASDPNIDYSNLQDSLSSIGANGSFTGSFSNIVASDPLFVDAGLRNYNLTQNSPCINKGMPSTDTIPFPFDWDNNRRIKFCRIDIGAYEFNGTLFPSYDNFWTGCVDTDWHKSGNWSINLIPTSSNNVYIPGIGFAANQPVVSGAADCNTITIDSDQGANVTISGSGVLNIQQ